MKSAQKTCLNCGNLNQAALFGSCAGQTSPIKVAPENTSITTPLKSEESPLISESIQVAEVSSSDKSEEIKEIKELRGVQNPLELIKPIENGGICTEDELTPISPISNLESLIEKVPQPERFPIEAKAPKAYSDEEIEKLYSLTRQKSFYESGIPSEEETFRGFCGLARHKSFCEKPKAIPIHFGLRPKRSSNLESVAEEIDKLHPLTHQQSFCEKSKVIPAQFVPRPKRTNALDSSTDVKTNVQYTRPVIVNDSKRKQHAPLILHPEKANLYANENLKKNSRRHSIGAVSRNNLASKSNLKESSVYSGCRIARDSKSLPGNVFEESRIADSTTPRVNNSLRGIKRRHSSITHSPDGSCTPNEASGKRRTRSEDRPNPVDENDPANQKIVAEEAHNRLRWPAPDSTLSRSGEILI